LAILFENVDAMDDDVGSSGVSNLDLLFAEVGSRGYEGRDFIVDSQYFSLPQRRRRRYIIFIFAIANPGVDFRLRESSTVFETMGRLVSACQRMPPCVSRILLTEDHVALENELTRRLAGDRLEKDVAEWPELHINVFRDAGKRWKAVKIQKEAKGSPWFSTLTPRERDALRYELALFPEYFARDISQSIDRISRSCRHEHDSDRHILPTQMPKQLQWLNWPMLVECSEYDAAREPRLLIGREALLLQGFPIDKVKALVNRTDEQLMSQLAGNMMSLPVVLAMSMAFFASVSWREGAAADMPMSTQDDMDQVTNLLARTRRKKIPRT
jgi:site-specific DNA-cytosine methylase